MLDSSPGFGLVEQHARNFLAIHTPIPEDRQEPRPPVQFRCPQCGLSQDFAACLKCGDQICEKCDLEHYHMRCLPSELTALLLDCYMAFMRIQDAINRGHESTAMNIAQAYRVMLQEKGI